uniref:NADH dehydrogenase subunit 6 n=1 Tax=Proasellus cavaticus TaxID=1281949 RepID=A0A485M8P4_9CRUS|nr:NADH dehydrogenase subunit 6 [Proasellus cavaticus]
MNLSLLALMALGGLFLASNTPHILITSLLFSTLLTALVLGLLKSFPWLAYILFLVFLGGILILFTYVSSLNSNPMMVKMKVWVILTFSSAATFLMCASTVPPAANIFSGTGEATELTPSMKELFTPLHYPLYLYLFIYLLLTLFYIVTLMKIYYAPLRSAV